jgi:hypothetical protein
VNTIAVSPAGGALNTCSLPPTVPTVEGTGHRPGPSLNPNSEIRATHGPQVQARKGYQRLTEAAKIVEAHRNTLG